MIPGTPGPDVIEAGDGDDTINGGGGADTICGEGGSDTVNGEGDNDWLDGGTAGTNVDTVTFLGTTAQLTADLADGTATTTAGESNAIGNFENLTGTNTFDLLRGDSGPNVLTGLAAADGFLGRGGDDTFVDPDFPTDQGAAQYPDATGPVTGTIGNGTHTLSGPGVGTDTLMNVRGFEGSPFGDQVAGDGSVNGIGGMDGDDVFEPGGAGDIVSGGSGLDRVSYANEGTVTVDLAASTGVTATGTDSLYEIENVTGSPVGDSITGDSVGNVIDGNGGDDLLTGGGGIDTASFTSLAQGVDANLATGAATGQGSDTLATIENLAGSSAQDFLTGDTGANAFDGNGGDDVVRFSAVAQGVAASLVAGTATGQGADTLADVESLTGSSQDDTLIGDGTANALAGLDGDDEITGGDGADTFLLGAGLDVVAAADGVADAIDCEGGGPDSGTVDGPAPLESYTDCDSDGDAVVDFLDACPAQAAQQANGCPPPPATNQPGATAQTKPKRCKKGFKRKKVKGKLKCVKKRKKKK